MKKNSKAPLSKPAVNALKLFQDNGGILRTTEAIKIGIHPRTLYSLRDDGKINEVVRGFYRLSDATPLENPDLVAVSLAIPKGVVCLVSALFFYGIGTQIPHEVHVALPRNSTPPRLPHPPVHTYWFTGEAYSEGVEEHVLDGVKVRVYGPEKTIADCFKYRNRLGLDVCLEALRAYRSAKNFNADLLIHFGGVCRVDKIMRPYVEAIL
jgi:predicted transcriptional regulator of viral defense system